MILTLTVISAVLRERFNCILSRSVLYNAVTETITGLYSYLYYRTIAIIVIANNINN